MSNICAAIGRGQLEVIKQRIAAKKKIYYTYKEALKDLPIEMMPIYEKGEPNFWLSVMTIENECKTSP